MSQVDATEVLTYLDALISEQAKVLLEGGAGAGKITRIEEYRAGVMLRRSMLRLRDNVQKLAEGRAAKELAEESGLTEMPEESQ